MAVPYRACIRSRSSLYWLRPLGLAFAAAHLFTGCALPGLHSQPLISLLAAPSRACIRSRSSLCWLRPLGLAFAAAHLFTGCALSGLHSQPLISLLAAPSRACIRSRSCRANIGVYASGRPRTH